MNFEDFLTESKSTELAKYYREMKKLNPKASPWLIFLAMANEAGIDIESKKSSHELEKLLKQFPPKERQEISNHAPATGPFLEPMSVQDIAKQIKRGVTLSRQAIHQTIQRAIPKYFKELKAQNPGLNAAQIFYLMAKSFGLEDDPKNLFNILPKEIKREVEKYAKSL